MNRRIFFKNLSIASVPFFLKNKVESFFTKSSKRIHGSTAYLKQYSIAYGKTDLSFNLPDNLNVTVVEPKYVSALPDPAGALKKAFEVPIGLPPLRNIVKKTDTVGIVFSDITRPVPSKTIILALREAIPHVADSQIILFNGTGSHRVQTDAELRSMLGDEVVSRYRIIQHNAHDADSHISAGVTSAGKEILMQREFLLCNVRILTGFIEPHFFAGFSGGGKAIMPGLASLSTIENNHSAAHMDCPNARWGVTSGNPLWEEINEAALLAKPTFLVNVTLNRNKEITGIFAGNFNKAHAKGCEFVKQTAMVPVDAPFDIVIGSNSGYPLDLNVYQSVKGMSAAAQVVKKGGSIIIAADCWDGLPDNSSYAKLMSEYSTTDEMLKAIRTRGFRRPEMWQAHIQALIAQRASIYFYSKNLTAEQLRIAHLNPCNDIENTVNELIKKSNREVTIAILPEGPQTVPYLKNKS
jgi:lactate racemase